MNRIAKKDGNSITSLVYCAMLIALSAVGALIKVSGTIAFDSMPGFFAGLFIGPWAGAIVASLGHLLTAATSGFPMTLPMHLLLMVTMGICAYVFGLVYKRFGAILGIIAGTILNGPISLLIVVPVSKFLGLPLNGWPLFSVLILPLTIASAVNLFLAVVVYKSLDNFRRY